MDLAKKAKELGLDAIHDTVHEMARDEARHGKAFAGLLARYYSNKISNRTGGRKFCCLFFFSFATKRYPNC